MATPRDYESTPVSDKLGLDDIIRGLARDLDDLRANKISNHDAIARALLAKQIFNGVRLYLVGSKFLEQHPSPAQPAAVEGKTS
jgi:hypothetical protein